MVMPTWTLSAAFGARKRHDGGKTSAREGRVMRCADCRFFHHDGREYGECRRMPPQGEFSANFTEDGYERRRFKVEVYRFANAVFPNLSRDMWCGEHQPKETNDDTRR